MTDSVYRVLRPAPAATRLSFTSAEWRRLAGLYGFIAVLHCAGWGLYLHYSADYPALVGLGFVAYMFGLRHAFDADHIAAIDDTVRFMLQKGQQAARRRLLLLAGPFDDRAGLRSPSPSPPGGRETGLPRAEEPRRHHRRGRIRHLPVAHRHPEPARAAGHPGGLAAGQGGHPQPRAPRGTAAAPRAPQSAVRRPPAEAHEPQLADVSARPAVRPGLRHRVGSRRCSR